jgi:hypothetical protein
MPACPDPGSSLMLPTSVVVDTTEPEIKGVTVSVALSEIRRGERVNKANSVGKC